MNKASSSRQFFKHNDFLSMAIELTLLSLTVTWGIELLAREFFKLG